MSCTTIVAKIVKISTGQFFTKKISTKNARFTTFPNLRQNCINAFEIKYFYTQCLFLTSFLFNHHTLLFVLDNFSHHTTSTGVATTGTTGVATTGATNTGATSTGATSTGATSTVASSTGAIRNVLQAPMLETHC